MHYMRHCWLQRGMGTSITSNKATGGLVLCIGRLPALPQRHARCSSPRVGPPCAPHDALCALADRTAYACLARGAPSFGDLHWPRATAIPRPSPRRRFPRHGVLHALQPGQHLCTQSCYALCARCHAASFTARSAPLHSELLRHLRPLQCCDPRLRGDTREVSVVDAGCRRIRRANAPPPHPSTTRSG